MIIYIFSLLFFPRPLWRSSGGNETQHTYVHPICRFGQSCEYEKNISSLPKSQPMFVLWENYSSRKEFKLNCQDMNNIKTCSTIQKMCYWLMLMTLELRLTLKHIPLYKWPFFDMDARQKVFFFIWAGGQYKFFLKWILIDRISPWNINVMTDQHLNILQANWGCF